MPYNIFSILILNSFLEFFAFEAVAGFVGGGDKGEAEDFFVTREEDVEQAFDAGGVAVFE